MDVVTNPVLIAERTIVMSLTILVFGLVSIGGLWSLRRFSRIAAFPQGDLAAVAGTADLAVRDGDPAYIQNLKALLLATRRGEGPGLSRSESLDLGEVSLQQRPFLQDLLNGWVAAGLARPDPSHPHIFWLAGGVLETVTREITAYHLNRGAPTAPTGTEVFHPIDRDSSETPAAESVAEAPREARVRTR